MEYQVVRKFRFIQMMTAPVPEILPYPSGIYLFVGDPLSFPINYNSSTKPTLCKIYNKFSPQTGVTWDSSKFVTVGTTDSCTCNATTGACTEKISGGGTGDKRDVIAPIQIELSIGGVTYKKTQSVYVYQKGLPPILTELYLYSMLTSSGNKNWQPTIYAKKPFTTDDRIVNFFSNADCTDELESATQYSYINPNMIPTDVTLPSQGTYNIYARYEDWHYTGSSGTSYDSIKASRANSPCSTKSISYTTLSGVNTQPPPPQNITPTSPTMTSGSATQLTFKVDGVQVGDKVSIFSSASPQTWACGEYNTRLGTTLASSTSVNITVPLTSLQNALQYYTANIYRDGSDSECVYSQVSYFKNP
jgi:hypothetical protein